MPHPTLLVTGASGQLGRLVLENLLAQRDASVIATTRTPEKLEAYAARGVEVRFADFDEPERLADAFSGADRLLLISTDALGGTGRRVQQHRAAIEAARQAGVSHLVYTSLLKADDSPLALMAADHVATEEYLKASGLGYTLWRNAFYADLLYAGLPPALASSRLVSSAGGGRIAYVTREDCGRAAAAALMSPFQGRRVLDITGPAALDATDLAGIASDVFGKTIVAVSVTAEVFQEGLIAAGTSPQTARVLAGINRGVSEGAMDVVSHDFEALTGQKATSVATFLSMHRAAFGS